MRIVYSINWDLFIEHYILEGSILLMGGEDSGEHKFKKPAFPHSQGYQPAESSTGEKRQLDHSNPGQNPVYIKDDGTQVSSKDPNHWGVNPNHDYTNKSANYKNNCQQMANLLEYFNKVHNHRLVNTCYDNNPILGEMSTEFFETFTESRNISSQPGTDQIANTVGLRNLFRSEANK